MAETRSWERITGRERRQWQLHYDADGFRLETARTQRAFSGTEAARLSIRRSWFRPVPRTDASAVEESLSRYLFRTEASSALETVTAWADLLQTTIAVAEASGRRISQEVRHTVESSRPREAIDWLSSRDRRSLRASLTSAELWSLDGSKRDIGEWVTQANERIFASELIVRRDFFDRVETSPLTEEQARAVVCYDNRVQVVASAGSGKISVMPAAPRAVARVHA